MYVSKAYDSCLSFTSILIKVVSFVQFQSRLDKSPFKERQQKIMAFKAVAVAFAFLFVQVCFGCEIIVKNVGQVRMPPPFILNVKCMCNLF